MSKPTKVTMERVQELAAIRLQCDADAAEAYALQIDPTDPDAAIALDIHKSLCARAANTAHTDYANALQSFVRDHPNVDALRADIKQRVTTAVSTNEVRLQNAQIELAKS